MSDRSLRHAKCSSLRSTLREFLNEVLQRSSHHLGEKYRAGYLNQFQVRTQANSRCLATRGVATNLLFPAFASLSSALLRPSLHQCSRLWRSLFFIRNGFTRTFINSNGPSNWAASDSDISPKSIMLIPLERPTRSVAFIHGLMTKLFGSPFGSPSVRRRSASSGEISNSPTFTGP